jgi:hypothetical protein
MKPWNTLCACVLMLLAGCSAMEDKLYEGYAVRPLDKESINPYMTLVKALQETNAATGAALIPTACFSVPVAATSKDMCKSARNQAVAVLAIASSSLCLKHRQSIYGREATANITLGTLTSLFAGAAAVASSDSAKTLYAALALFSNSERSLVNETVYKQMIVTAVDQKIVEAMDTKAQTMDQSLSKSIDDYGVHEALRDVITLHTTCSFMTGLRLALSEGTRGSNARKILTLRQNLMRLDSEVKQECTTPASLQCTESKQRYSSITASLKVLEAQGE